MTKFKKLLSVLLCVCIIAVPVASGIISAGAESNSDLQKKIEDLEAKNQEYQKTLESAQNDISEKENYNATLASKIENLDEKIEVTRKAIDEANAKISDSQKKIDQGNKNIEDQVDALCQRLRTIYMAGSASDLEIILGAKDFSDLIDKMTLVKNLSKKDQELIDNINDKLTVINKEKAELEKNKADLEKNEASLDKDLKDLNKTLEENKEVLKDLKIQSDQAKNFIANNNNEKARFEAQLAKNIAEEEAAARAKQAQSANSNSGSTSTESSSSSSSSSSSTYVPPAPSQDDYVSPPSSGGYTWPTPGFYYLSSQWNEDRTTYNHGAIDIAGGGIMGARVVAADSGTVTITNDYCPHNWGKFSSCGCGGGYGKYIMIDHGNGKETLYAHLSSLAVSSGQHVSKGQTIGYVGTTGYSTGPHLHFECRYNGVKYNPMDEY